VVSERNHYRTNASKLSIRGRVLMRDTHKDLAVVELPTLPASAKALTLADKSVSPGQKLHSIGNPVDGEALWVYTSGTVRQVFHKHWQPSGNGNRYDFAARIILAQSPVNPGDSGGPVVNDKAELVGVVSSSNPGQIINICIDIREVKDVLAQAAKVVLPTDVARVDPKDDPAMQKLAGRWQASAEGSTQITLSVEADGKASFDMAPASGAPLQIRGALRLADGKVIELDGQRLGTISWLTADRFVLDDGSVRLTFTRQ